MPNADAERPEIAACLDVARKARAGELLKRAPPHMEAAQVGFQLEHAGAGLLSLWARRDLPESPERAAPPKRRREDQRARRGRFLHVEGRSHRLRASVAARVRPAPRWNGKGRMTRPAFACPCGSAVLQRRDDSLYCTACGMPLNSPAETSLPAAPTKGSDEPEVPRVGVYIESKPGSPW